MLRGCHSPGWGWCGIVLAVGMLACGGAASAADPALTALLPPGGQRGTELEVTLQGARLADAEEILWYETGIETLAIAPIEKNDNAVKARLRIAPDCAVGVHRLRVRTASGLTNLRTFSIGPYPLLAEAEPNSEFDQPQAIALGTCVDGVVQNEDVDHYAVAAKQGQRITAEVEALRLGGESFDPYLAILDSARFVLASADDTPLVWQDGVCSIIAPKDDTYTILVRESSYRGNGNSRYRLHVGDFPRPRAVYPAGGKAGTELEVRWIGDVAGERSENVKLPDAPADDFTLQAADDKGIAPWPYAFRLTALDNVLEQEPNNTPAEATPAAEVPRALNGILAEAGDVDCFKFTAKKGQALDVRVFARSLRSPVDAVLNIRKPDGGNLAGNDDSGSPDSYLRFNVPADGEYIAQVADHLGHGGAEYVYRVEITTVEPKLTLSLPERKQFDDIVAAVPRGNRFAMMVAAQRQDFGGEIGLDFRNLPPGLTVQAGPILDGRVDVPVLVSAAAEATTAGGLVELVGRWQPENKVEGPLRQRTSLIRGQNNREVWNQYSARFAAAVTAAVPFAIELVQPRSPLVQSGSKEIKAVATRAEGFSAPITLQVLYTPPGVSTTNSVTIGEGQTEAVVPLTANGNAAVGQWKFAVLGSATVGNGAVAVSSQLIDLEIAPPMVAFTFTPVSVEKGKSTELLVQIQQNAPFEGNAQAELVGMPAGVTSEPREFNREAAELAFPIATTEQSPAGQHKNVLARVVVTVNGEPVAHTLGSGELRIQNPPPPPPEPKEKPAEASQPQPEPPKQAESKPLSRLEQLRQQRQQSEQ